MENRRPPRNNSPGPGKYYDRGRTGPPNRSGGPRRNDAGNAGNSSRGDGRAGGPTRIGDGAFPQRPGGSINPRYNAGANRFGRPGAPNRKKPLGAEPQIKITSELQITDGKFKGRLLINSVSPKCVPTPRKIRETMFRMIFRRVRAGRFLDLCSGCGTVGLEAISVGSMLSTFVERSARVSSMLRKNLADLGVKDGHSEVVEMEAAPFLMRVGKRKRLWDVIFLGDVAESDRDELLDLLGRGRVIKPGGIAVIEHSSENPLPDTIGLLRRWRTINDENVSLSFYNRKP